MSKKDLPTCGNPDFDWDAYEFDGGTRLVENKKIKKHPGDKSKVYCHAPYAQELYEKYYGASLNLQEPKHGSIVEGTVTTVSGRFASVDVNWREDVTLDMRKENESYHKYIQPGFPIEIIVEKVKGTHGWTYTGSYTKNIETKKREEIRASIGEPIAFAGKVKSLIHGGYFIDIDGIECFMPGSLGGMNKLVDFNSLIGETLFVMPINYSKDKGYIVVSHREYLKTLVPGEIENLEFGTKYAGFVTGCSKHGIFVEFNKCLTGLIAKKDIPESMMDDFENRRIKAGNPIDFYVSEVVDGSKIVATIEEPAPVTSAWDDIDQRYKIPTYVTGKIKSVKNYGLFVEIEPKVVGLLHKSHIEPDLEFEVGQEIDVKIVKIDKESKKVDFTM